MEAAFITGVVIASVALGVAAVLICGVPALGLAPAEIHLDHRSKRFLAATAVAALLVVAAGVAVVLNRGHASAVTHLATAATTPPSRVGHDPATSATTRSTRPSSHRSRGVVTTGPGTSRPGVAPRSSSTSTSGVKPLGDTPTTVGRARRRHRSTTTTTRGRTTTTTTQPVTTTTQPETTTTQPPTTTTEPPTTTTTTAPQLVGDINLDGMVGCMDMSLLVPEIGEVGSALAGDLNHDGTVDQSDLTLMLANWTGDGTTWVNPLDPLQQCP